jgi:hypothetical protein
MSFRVSSPQRALRLIWAVAMILTLCLAALPVTAAPLTVTTVTVNSPSLASQAFVMAGESFDVNYTVTSSTGGNGEARFYLGATLIKTVPIVLGLSTTLNETVTIPGGTSEDLYDVMVEVKENPQSNWVQGISHDAVIVDNTPPDVPADVLIAPNGGENYAIGSVHAITWEAGAITDAYLAASPIALYASFDSGGAWSMIAWGEANDGSFDWVVPGPTTTHARVKVEAIDKAGNTASDMSDADFTIHAVDPTAPTVNVTAPVDNAKVRGAFTVAATASDPDSGITQVAFAFAPDGAWTELGVDTSVPYTAPWDTTALADGSIVRIRAIARNGVGAETTDTNNGIVVDNSAPAVSLTGPAAGAFFAGTISVTASANDPHSGIMGVEFQYRAGGGWVSIGVDNAAPYQHNWNTAIAPDGAVELRAIATNGSGLTTNSAIVAVMVDNTPPAKTEPFLLHPNGGEIWQIGATQQVTWDDENIEDVNLRDNPIALYYKHDGTWTLLAENEPNDGSFDWVLTGLLTGTDYRVRIVITDKAGNATEDMSDANFTIWAMDSTGPAVAITSPAGGALLKDSVNVAATATDPESGVAYVEFWYQAGGGWVKFSTDWTAPYSANWNTVGLPDGTAHLKAAARNGVGMSAESTVVDVTIDNSAPSVNLVDPAAGLVLSGFAVDMTATAADSLSGIASVAFYYRQHGSGTWTLIHTDTTAPYSAVWDTTLMPDGPGYVKARACNGVALCSEDTHSITVRNLAEISLRTGWNMISLPLVPYDSDIGDVLASLIAHGTVIQVRAWTYEGGSLSEKIWTPVGPTSLSKMKDGQGYWIQMSAPDTLIVQGTPLPPPPMLPPSYAVFVGWNQIGFTSTHNQPVQDYLGGDLYHAMSSLYGYDVNTGLYFVPSQFEPTRGYWLGSTAAGTIYP